MKRALVLSSGGSRGQFHVGAVKHLMGDLRQHYDIFAGVSVGALIAGFLAQYPKGAEDEAADGLVDLFTPLSSKHLYRPWRMGLMSGFWKSSLYDASPLRELLRTAVDVTTQSAPPMLAASCPSVTVAPSASSRRVAGPAETSDPLIR